MSLGMDDVRRIAELAHIDIDDEQALKMQVELNDIFKMIERIQAVDTEGVEPMMHPHDGVQRHRSHDDVCAEILLPRSRLLYDFGVRRRSRSLDVRTGRPRSAACHLCRMDCLRRPLCRHQRRDAQQCHPHGRRRTGCRTGRQDEGRTGSALTVGFASFPAAGPMV